MKQNFLMSAACLCALAVSPSCSRLMSEQETDPSIPRGVTTTFVCGAEEVGGSKVEPGSGSGPLWQAGDEIKLFYLDPESGSVESVTATTKTGGAEATFYATVPEDASRFWAVYPSSFTSSVDEEGHFTVGMDGAHQPTFANACICIAQCGSERRLQFKNICAILQFTVGHRGDILQMAYPGGEALAGTIKVSLDEDSNVVYDEDEPYSSGYSSKTYTAPTSAGTWYLPVLPLNTMSNATVPEIAVNFYSTYDDPAVFKSTPTTFRRSTITNIGTLDGKIRRDYFFKEDADGTGDGTTWEKAMNASQLLDLLQYNASEEALTRYVRTWQLKGSNLHLAAGTYDMGQALTIDFSGASGNIYATINIKGGYPANLTGTSTDGRDPDTYESILSGGSTHAILGVFDRARVNIDGVVFADAKGATEPTSDKSIFRGAALYIKDSSSGSTESVISAELKSAPRVWLTQCTFRDNQTTSSTLNLYEGGSAINITNGAVYADRCLFQDNEDAGAAGCVCLSGNYENEYLASYAFFNACTFTGNRVLSDAQVYGSVLSANRKGSLLGLYNCTLYNNNQEVDGVRHNYNVINMNRSCCLMANTTIVDYNNNDSYENAPGYCVRINAAINGTARDIFANNLWMNTAASTTTLNRGGGLIWTPGANDPPKVYLKGANLFGSWISQWTNTTYLSVTVDDEYRTGSGNTAGYLYSALDNPSWTSSPAPGYFAWKGTLNSGAVTCNKMSLEAMKAVLASEDINHTGDNTHVTFAYGPSAAGGAESYDSFYYWLNSRLNAVCTDVRGYARPSTGWAPGSYDPSASPGD